MASQDIAGSRAHARMLAEQGIISGEDQAAIDEGLQRIAQRIEDGSFIWDVNDEDVHMAVEGELTREIGTPGARLHTGRSRNDQVVCDLRLLAKDLCNHLIQGNIALRRVLLDAAEKNLDVVMPGYTHLQHAQPVLLGHHLLAYFWDVLAGLYAPCSRSNRSGCKSAWSGGAGGHHLSARSQTHSKLLGSRAPFPIQWTLCLTGIIYLTWNMPAR